MPGSIASGSWTGNAMRGDPNNPGLAFSSQLAGPSLLHRRLATRRIFQLRRDDGVGVLGSTHHRQHQLRLLRRHERRHGEQQRPDLHPARSVRDELLRRSRRAAARSPPRSRRRRGTPTSQQDSYLSKHRGEYAERGAVFLPIVKRMDLSVSQDIFRSVRRGAALGPDPPRHHQLRQPAELATGASGSAWCRTRS